jgi:hypothetical protein
MSFMEAAFINLYLVGRRLLIVMEIIFRNEMFVLIFYECSNFTLKNHTNFLVTW